MPLLKTEAPELQNIETWINSESVDLKDGTNLLYFWNYSCSCCKDRLEIFQEIHEKHPEVTVIGIHNPKFEFEKNKRNLEKAVEKRDITHPIAHDRSGKTSEAYNMAYSNRALIISEGKIKYQQSSKLGFEELTQKISEVLNLEDKELSVGSDEKKEAPSQVFLGYNRAEGLNEGGNHPGEKKYQLPQNRKSGNVYLKNVWSQAENYIEARKGSKLIFKFGSSKLDIVVNPNDNIRDIEVLLDGETVSEKKAGKDLRVEKGKSYIRVKNPGLYNLIDSNHQETELTLIPDKKTRIYALSFE